MASSETIARMRKLLDEADADEAKKRELMRRMFQATQRLSRVNETLTAEMLAEEIVRHELEDATT